MERRAFRARPTCHNCGNKFALAEGVLNHFLSDNPFAAHIIRSSWLEGGHCNVTVGQATNVKFTTKPAKVFNVALSATDNVIVEPSLITTSGFTIVSSCKPTLPIISTVVNWTGFGEAKDHHALPWKEALANSKGYELQKDTNMEVVTSETAFELFIDDLLQQRLKVTSDTMRWMLRRSIEEKTSIWYAEATGQKLAAQYTQEYQIWQKQAKELRDSIVHWKREATIAEAKAAFKAVVKLIARIDPAWFLRFPVIEVVRP